jgi:hypothetical protein
MGGRGEIETKTNARSTGTGTTRNADFNLYNFEIDKADVKPELRDHLEKIVIPALKKNPKAVVKLVGSADRQGPPQRNKELSVERANAIKTILEENGVTAQVTESQGAGAPDVGPLDNPVDRGVRLALDVPIKIEAITLHTDDWARELKWDDVIGLKGEDGRPIERFNIQVTVSGAPRMFMQDAFLLQRSVEQRPRNGPFTSHWLLPLAPQSFQPSDDNLTSYRDSGPLKKFDLGDRDAGRAGLAIINRESVPIDFGLAPGSIVPRGVAAVKVPGSDQDDRIGPEQLLRAGGVGRFVMTGPDRIVVKWFVRRPATVFAFSNNGNRDGCLSTVGECWFSPKQLQGLWKGQKDMRVLVLAAPFILNMNRVSGAVAVGGPGAEWAKMLESKNGPFQAIVGYDAEAPDIGNVGGDIAKRLGKVMSKGLADGAAFVDAWLKINAEHDGKNTWNAVGMDRRGYKWIVERSAWSRSFDTVPFISGDGYKIVGPVPIA